MVIDGELAGDDKVHAAELARELYAQLNLASQPDPRVRRQPQ